MFKFCPRGLGGPVGQERLGGHLEDAKHGFNPNLALACQLVDDSGDKFVGGAVFSWFGVRFGHDKPAAVPNLPGEIGFDKIPGRDAGLQTRFEQHATKGRVAVGECFDGECFEDKTQLAVQVLEELVPDDAGDAKLGECTLRRRVLICDHSS